MPELVFGDGVGMVDFVAEDEEGYAREFLHGEEGVELGFALRETFDVLGVDEEDDSAYFGEVVFPEATGYLPPVSYPFRCICSLGLEGRVIPCW
mgnify:CR=1 FL=1